MEAHGARVVAAEMRAPSGSQNVWEQTFRPPAVACSPPHCSAFIASVIG